MTFERRMMRIVEKGDAEEFYFIVFNSSLDGFEGPGYLGYIFYILFFTQLIQAYSKYIINNLSIASREKIRRNLISRLHIIRRSYFNLLSDYEWDFIRKYGFDEDWIRSKVLSRNIGTKVDNIYYSAYFKEVRRIMESERRKASSEFKTLYKLYTSLMKTGIEISLIFAWILYLYTYLFQILRGNGELDDIVDASLENGLHRKIIHNLIKMSRLYGYDEKWVSRTFKYAMFVLSKNVDLEVNNGNIEVKVLGSWPPILLLYSFIVMGVKPSARDMMDAQKPMCRLCRLFWIGVLGYFMDNEIKVVLHTFKIRHGLCILKLEAIKEAGEEAT
ncbi:hypothetical protein DRN87_00460 [Candidatus Geothermarchaeota archaeon]|nr:MAG: hypothetical protein DRN87_00460 [Candidatus Geothermarchaeota archaeon]